MTKEKEEKRNRFRNSISLKLIIVVSLSLLLLLPTLRIKSLIREREDRKDVTIAEITQKIGKEQTINGPILVIPYTQRIYTNKSKYSDEIHHFQVLPSELKINGVIHPTLRYRSIYKVVTYNGNFSIDGTFSAQDLKEWPNKYHKILWDQAHLVIGITDLKGITKNITVKWNKEIHNFSPGKDKCSMFNSGINAEVIANQANDNSFHIDLSLNGSQSIYFTPIGNTTHVQLKGDWNTPSFDGDFLPEKPHITDSSFQASWNVIEMNRSYPQKWNDNAYDRYYNFQSFGAKLLLPVDTYQKSERSVKYSFLFIALTFLIIFFSEITSKNRVHPVQYLIIGFGLIIFYSLLISLAEHVGFNYAYLIASTVIIGMSTLYVKSLLKLWKPTLVITTSLIILYAFLFTILQIADYALLIGNIGLVIILGLVMYFSKKVNWYGESNVEEDNR